jgi:hypothetical protein
MVELPQQWPEFRVHVFKSAEMQPGSALFNLTDRVLEVPLTAAIIDAGGNT